MDHETRLKTELTAFRKALKVLDDLDTVMRRRVLDALVERYAVVQPTAAVSRAEPHPVVASKP